MEANNTTGPLIIPGTYVTFICTHGTISLNGVQYCSHTTTASRDLCDSSSCQFTMTGTVDSGYTFYGWVLSGQASVGCGSCLSTTLTIYTPNSNDVYSASVNLNTSPPPPPPTVTVAISTFENYSTGWQAAEVQACLGGDCATAGNGGHLTLEQYQTYTITAVDLPRLGLVLKWNTNAGSLSNTTNNPVSLYTELSGSLALITQLDRTSWAGYVYSPSTSGRNPAGAPPVSNCFGGGTCTGPSGTQNGSGTSCVITGFSETAGDFLYVAINYLYGTAIITSVSDGGVDTFSYVGGEFANSQSVAFYDVASEHGGTVTITVSIRYTEFGTCRVGQLNAETRVGVVGSGNSIASGTSLEVSNSATNEPSLLLAMIGSTRPSGAYTMNSPVGNWLTGGLQGTGWNPGTYSGLYALNDSDSGTVTFAFSTVNPVSISGIAVEFYGVNITSVSAWLTVPNNAGPGFGVWVGIGGLPTSGTNALGLWQAGIGYNSSAVVPYAFWEACPGGSSGLCSGTLDYGYKHGFSVSAGDTLIVTVSWAGGVFASSIRDWSVHGRPYWNGTYANATFNPHYQSAEWVLEPKGSSMSATNTTVWNMTVNGAFPGLLASYVDEYDSSPGFYWLGTTLSSGTPNFIIYHT